ncbi:MAG TPA: SgcJ/EcaC family oxidoreductase, partial [Candidatus Obscuribacterales bacterium]
MKRPEIGRNRSANFSWRFGLPVIPACLVCSLVAGGSGSAVLATSASTAKTESSVSGSGGSHEADQQAIRKQAAEYASAFRKADTAALAEMWAPDAVYVDDAGTVYKGREAIVDEMKAFFAKFGGQPLEVVIESIEFPSDDTAIEHGITRLASAKAPHAADRYTAVHVKRDGRWQMVNVSESPLRPASGPESLRELGWLVGSWHVDGPNGTLALKAEWVGNNNIIRCTFDTQGKDGSKTSQTQFIFWNPHKRRIWSWQYDWSGG